MENKKSIDKKMIWNLVCLMSAVGFIFFLAILIGGIGYSYKPILTLVVLILLGLVLTWIAQKALNYLRNEAGKKGIEEGFRFLHRGRYRCWIVMILYWMMLSAVLWVPIDGYCPYFVDLVNYNLIWIIVLLYVEPPIVFGSIVLWGIGRQQTELVHALVTSKQSKEAMASELEIRMKQAVAEQVKSERMKIDLITNVSHDLKTPLTSIIGYVELMKKEEMSDVLKDYLEVLDRKTGLLKEMIEKVFDLAKASSQNIELKPEKLEMNRLVNQILADMQDTIAEKENVLKTTFTEEPTMICVDSGFIYRIIQNLIDNALKYAMKGTRIFLSTKVLEQNIYFEVINVSNYPLDFETERIKERFVRADASRTTEGNGLGLAIVETYTNALGGKFDINVEGDTFKATLCFPLVKEEKKAINETDPK